MVLLTNLLLEGEGSYVQFGRELQTQDSRFDYTESNTILVNSVVCDVQYTGQNYVETGVGIRYAQGWLGLTDPLSLVQMGDYMIVIGSSTKFEVQGLEQYSDHFEFILQLRT